MSQKILVAMLMVCCVVIGLMWGQLHSTPLAAQSVGDDGYPFQLVQVQDISSSNEDDVLNGLYMVFDRETGTLSFLDPSIRDSVRPAGQNYEITRDDKGGAFVVNTTMGATWKVSREGVNPKLKLIPFIDD